MKTKMTRREWLKATAASLASFTALASFPSLAKGMAAQGAAAGRASKVWMTTDLSADGLVRIYEAVGHPLKGRIAVKISTGEPGGHNFLQPSLIEKLVKKVDGTIVECNTAYAGRRNSTEEHLKAAREHGFFDIAKVDIMDAEGDFEIPVKDKKHLQCNLVGTHLKNYNAMINLAHFKGHAMAGFGGVIKNQSIGVASSNGKAYIHTAGKTRKPEELWNYIDDQDGFLESMAAATQAVANYFENRIVYIDVMNNLSVDCDCDASPEAPKIKDIGILASLDPVALDQACLDLVYDIEPTEGNDNRPLVERIESRHGRHTVDYAERIGLGTKKYELVKVG